MFDTQSCPYDFDVVFERFAVGATGALDRALARRAAKASRPFGLRSPGVKLKAGTSRSATVAVAF